MSKKRKIAIAGGPNVGKSALFNALTKQYVVVSNYPGTSIEITRGNTLIDNVMYEEGIEIEGPIDALTLKRLGQRLNTQAVILGTIDLAQDARLGSTSYPILAMTLRMVEVNSGLILWQSSGNSSGESFSRRLFGLKTDDPYQITDKLVNKMLRTAPAGYF